MAMYRHPETESLRQQVLTHYGSVCKRCGTDDSESLQIDHVNDDGAAFRKLKRAGGGSYYRWIIQQGFPSNLQLLCANCNWKKYMETRQMERIVEEKEEPEPPSGTYQLNSAVSREVYSYVKSEKIRRKCTEKQVLQDMYHSHIHGGSKSYVKLRDALQGYAAEMQVRCDQIMAQLEAIRQAVQIPTQEIITPIDEPITQDVEAVPATPLISTKEPWWKSFKRS